MRALTETQQAVFNFVRDRIHDGMPPTTSEITREFGWRSDNTAFLHLKALERKGWIERSPNTVRGLALPRKLRGLPIVSLPLTIGGRDG